MRAVYNRARCILIIREHFTTNCSNILGRKKTKSSEKGFTVLMVWCIIIRDYIT